MVKGANGRKIIVAAGFVLIICGLLVALRTRSSNKKNAPNRSVRTVLSLPYGEIVSNGRRDSKKIALTFDADMTYGMLEELKRGQVSTWYNKKVIDTLKQNGAKATLFLSGLWMKAYPDATKSFALDPLFELGNHSYSHVGFTKSCYNLGSATTKQMLEEITKTNLLLKEYTGTDNQLFRFPGGCFDKQALTITKEADVIPIQWDVVSGDAFNENTNTIVNNIKTRVTNGSIVIMHLNGNRNAPKTAEALEEIIPYLKSQGYELVTLSELLNSK